MTAKWSSLGALAALALSACGPRAAPSAPSEPAAAPARAAAAAPSGRQVLIGRMCPEAAAGRPGVEPLVVRKTGWSDDPGAAADPVARGEARQFSVLAWDGRRAGILSVTGLARVTGEDRVAMGGYVGVSPCAGPATERRPDREVYPECVAAQQHCGLAVSVLEADSHTAPPFGEEPEPVDLATAGACVSEGKLVFDLDGDGSVEAFPAEDFVAGARPAEEVSVVPVEGASCTPRFASRHLLSQGDPAHAPTVDLVGVLDLDLDGRRDLVLAFRNGDRRTWAIYSATRSPARLDLVALERDGVD